MSILAEQIRKKHEVSKEFLQQGFQVASGVGELLNEVELLVEPENLETWLTENKLEFSFEEAQKYMKLFRGEKVRVTIAVYKEQNQELDPQEKELDQPDSEVDPQEKELKTA
jgi:AAA+ ATPase superfamily predicted ATPase